MPERHPKRFELERFEFPLLLLFAFFSVTAIAGTQIVLGLLLIAWLHRHVRNRTFSNQPLGIERWIIAIFALGAIASCFSPRPIESLVHMKHLLLLVTLYIVADIGSRSPTNFLAVWIASATGLAIFGLIRFAAASTQKVMAMQSTTMTWGAMLVPILAMCAALLLSPGRDRWQRALLVAALGILLVALFFSYVRGAYVGVIVAFGVLLALQAPRWLAVFAGMAAVLVLVAPASVQERFLSITDLTVLSTQVRLVQWEHAWSMFLERPVFGYGWIDLGSLHRSMFSEDPALPEIVNRHVFEIGHFHNNPIMWAMIWGAPGVLLLTGFFLKLGWDGWRIYRGFAPGHEEHWLAAGGLAALCGFLANGMFDWTFGDAETITIFWISAGVVYSLRGRAVRRGDRPPDSAAASERRKAAH